MLVSSVTRSTLACQPGRRLASACCYWKAGWPGLTEAGATHLGGGGEEVVSATGADVQPGIVLARQCEGRLRCATRRGWRQHAAICLGGGGSLRACWGGVPPTVYDVADGVEQVHRRLTVGRCFCHNPAQPIVAHG